MTTTARQFAIAMPVKADDPLFRIAHLAENRAKRNGRDPVSAGRAAMAMYKLASDIHEEPKIEHILCTVAGEYSRAPTTV